MKSNNYDVVIIGAGPAGSVTARHLALKGYSVLLIEKRPQIGVPVRCGEATGRRSRLADFGPINEDAIETDIHGVVLYAQGGVSIKADINDVGLMVDRTKFDPWYAELAEQAGVEVICSARATDIRAPHNNERVVCIEYQKEVFEISARMVVGSDGVEALTGRWTGLKTRHLPPKTCTGIELKLDVMDENPNHLTFWQGHDYINDGYIWSFPKVKSGTTNFGAGFITPKLGSINVYEAADEWREKLYPGSKVLGVTGGAIPVSGCLEESVADHFLLVGDSAHHTNPLTGGGIASGMAGGLVAAEHIDRAFKAGDFSKQFLNSYEKGILSAFGDIHHRQMRMRDYILDKGADDQAKFFKMVKDFVDHGKINAFVKQPFYAVKTAWDLNKLK